MTKNSEAYQARATIALLCIDLQRLDLDRNAGLLAQQEPSIATAYLAHMKAQVLPNVERLQTAFRDRGFEVLHARIQSMTSDGRDRSPWHKKLGIHVKPSDPMGHFISGVEPLDDEMIFNKTASGVFHSTNLQYVLNNLGISALVVCGVFTDECVENAVRTGCDLGYNMTVATDACAAVTPKRHEDALDSLRDRYAHAATTSEVINALIDGYE